MKTMKETVARLRDRIRETQESIKELDLMLMYINDKEGIRILDKIDSLQDKLKEYKFIESNIINQYNNLVDLIYTSEMLIKYIDNKKC